MLVQAVKRAGLVAAIRLASLQPIVLNVKRKISFGESTIQTCVGSAFGVLCQNITGTKHNPKFQTGCLKSE
jgi:hypothetical protein